MFQWFEEKLQEVECEEQRLRKLHAVVETLVNHRKGNNLWMHLKLGEIDVSSELDMGGHAVPKPLSHSLKFSAHLVLMFRSKRYACVSWQETWLSHCGHCTFYLGREPSQVQLDLGCGLLLVWFELVAYIHKMISQTLATWSNEQFVNVGKPGVS